MNKLASLVIILSGLSTVAASAYWGATDYIALVHATNAIEQKVKLGHTDMLPLLYHRSNSHRTNVGFEGTWMLLGGILTATGFLVSKN